MIGAGAAGSAAAAELASRGVGYVAVVDGATTTLGDLCGQASLYTPDVGANRAEAVVAKLGILNPNVQAEAYPVDVDEANAAAIVMGHDIALDCSRDSGEQLAAACAEHGVELICGGGRGHRCRRARPQASAIRHLMAARAVGRGRPMRGLRSIARVARELRKDVAAARDRDPAARTVGTLEILLTYPGVHAILAHRISHALHSAEVPLLPRLLSNASRIVTGIEIHPAAKIGEDLFVDHGTGVVIGETAEIGDRVTLLQGVTLGGTGFAAGQAPPDRRGQRHARRGRQAARARSRSATARRSARTPS